MGWAFDETVITSDGCFQEYRRATSGRRRRWEDLVRDWRVCADIGVRTVSLVGGLHQKSGDNCKYLREEALDLAYMVYLADVSSGVNVRSAFVKWVESLIEFLAFPLVGLKVTSGDQHWTVASEIGLLPWWASLGHPGGLVVTTEPGIIGWETARECVDALLLDRWTRDRIAIFKSDGA